MGAIWEGAEVVIGNDAREPDNSHDPRCFKETRSIETAGEAVITDRKISNASARPAPEIWTQGGWNGCGGVTQVAIESTGVYWRPVWAVLEGGFDLLLVNARHVKHVPGRTTDVKDSEWIAQLLKCGLLKGSIVPPPPIRDLRDLTRPMPAPMVFSIVLFQYLQLRAWFLRKNRLSRIGAI